MKKDINEIFKEATKQLGMVMAHSNSPFLQRPSKGYLRGIDFYSASKLLQALMVSIYKYRNMAGIYPDLLNPAGFNEKILWFKFFGMVKVPESGNKLHTAYFIPKGLKKVITCPEIVWHSDSPKLPDNEELQPGTYYLKSNHGCAMNKRIQYPLQPDTLLELENFCDEWLKSPYGMDSGEWWYNVFPKEILIERSVTGNEDSISWGFYVFRNKIPYISVVKKTENGQKLVWIDGNGKRLPFQKNPPKEVLEYELPKNFELARNAAISIGKKFRFVRVDIIFGPDEELYLGEVTFSPGNGLTYRPAEFDKYLGGFWKLM